MISIVIPTHNCSSGLDLCLKSCLKSQYYVNEIIVVVDGNYDINKEVLNKYENVRVIIFKENLGLPKGINEGVYRAEFDKVLIVNDDNVFPQEFDRILLEEHYGGVVLTPNQIEPYSTMFKQFHIKDLGRNPETFDLNKYWEYERSISENRTDISGSTFPIFMEKHDFHMVGGWDERYNKMGVVCDWDFFLKCDMVGLDLIRTYKCHFYHFISLTTKFDKKKEKERLEIEKIEHNRAKEKWGSYIKHDSTTNLKYL